MQVEVTRTVERHFVIGANFSRGFQPPVFALQITVFHSS